MSQGDKLGKYEVIRQIAAGGMTELYLARTVGMEGFEKLVCVKRILPEHSDNPSFVNMFLNEARLAATLHHPNVAQVYDIGQESGECFFSMEYVHGEDLGRLSAAARENGVPISLDCALTLASGLCAGLHHAHEKASPDGKPLGVVHRDVSPTNVLVGYDGAVKLVDFGIARAGGEPTTSPNGLKGRAAYMSPEQCRGNAVLDRRSDLFSVGAMLYELTTGRPPFQAETEHAVLEQIVSRDAEPPSKLVPAYPAALEAIVLRALARDVHSRFGTALELQNQLEDFAHENRLRVSPLVLARLMSTLFPARLEEWDHARAQGAFFVEQHVVRTLIESGKTPRGMARDASQDEFGGAAFTETGMVAPWDSRPLANPTSATPATPYARHPSPSVARHPSPDMVASAGLPTLRLPTPLPVPNGMQSAVPSGGLSPRQASMPVPNMPGAVPIVTPMMGPSVASAGTLVSSALQAGGASAAPAKTSAPLGPMQAGMFVPAASGDFGGPGEASRVRVAQANGAAALEPPMANHRSSSARPTMIVRTQQRSWLPVIAVAGAGAVGAIALWIIMNGNQASTATPRQEPAAVAAPAGSAAGSPAPAADRPAEPAAEAAPAKAAAVDPASAAKADPATPTAPTAAPPTSAAAAAPSRGGSPSSAADAPSRGAAQIESVTRPAAAMLSSSPEDAKPELVKKRTAKFAPDPRGKPVRPKTRLDAKRADPKRAGKAEPKEPSWNDDSPFLPVQTPKR